MAFRSQKRLPKVAIYAMLDVRFEAE